jgi:hypothetical protein
MPFLQSSLCRLTAALCAGDDMTVVVEGRVTYHFFVKGIDGKLAQV